MEQREATCLPRAGVYSGVHTTWGLALIGVKGALRFELDRDVLRWIAHSIPPVKPVIVTWILDTESIAFSRLIGPD